MKQTVKSRKKQIDKLAPDLYFGMLMRPNRIEIGIGIGIPLKINYFFRFMRSDCGTFMKKR